ncbi:RluA family pseudouridine synthase [Plebeiibacterium sediminum]|uniref:RluA family pseudouridine synthase n=1 Tax=Plebeiibacterium sediminum TaxID=2992112 RepID=A0AAE3M884_9BACT|nr:RluA family pseudouridine synthase [Plebeiobacterium sediminum]MCW3788664.1 RluA family pseudouridine synthase [Plebeiobacterium sediminum]
MQDRLLEKLTVPHLDERKRLSDIAPELFKALPSKKSIKKAIKSGHVYIDEKRGQTADFIKGGEVLELFENKKAVVKPTIEYPIEVVFEDDYLAVVHKPAGILVSGNKKITLENSLPSNLKRSTQPDALDRPEPIHRLDYPTSGALLIGKTQEAVIALNKVFESRSINKQYLAITIGEMPVNGIIEGEVDGKRAKSAYKVLKSEISERFTYLNLVELTLFTGRRHQLRKHLSSIGNPILGDAEYGKEGLILKGKGLYLHSYLLEFTHPFTNEKMKVVAPVPKKFKKIFDWD